MNEYDIILIDGSSYLFRAYHALPPLENSEGMPTGAIYGVINMIKKLQSQFPSSKMIVVFDPKGGSFRNEIYPEYKADRGETPSDLQVQIPILQDIIVKMGLPLIIKPGYEADDVIATLARSSEDKSVLISTLDKDLAQLVNDRVHLINTMHDKRLDPDAVFEKFGVRPDQIGDYLALIGDRSDNIPGITSVGPKTAAKWLSLYQDLDGIKKHQLQIKGKVGDRLREEISQLDLSRQLVALVEDLDLGATVNNIMPMPQDTEGLKEHFTTLGFRKWLAELQAEAEVNYTIINSSNEDSLFRAIGASDQVLFSFGPEVLVSPEITIEHFGLLVNEHCYIVSSQHCDLRDVLLSISQQMRGKALWGFDLKWVHHLFSQHAVDEPESKWFDGMLACYVINSGSRNTIESAVLHYTGQAMIIKKGDSLDIQAAKSAWNIYSMLPEIKKRLSDANNLKLFDDIEMPLMHILAKMERTGVLIDYDGLLKFAGSLGEEIQQIEAEAYQMVDYQFNLASPKQLREVLFNQLNLPVLEKTPKGEQSTSESVLKELATQHPLVPLILRHRTLSKIKTTYAEALPGQADEQHRVHGSFNQAVTVTGRLSSTNPNLQNVPIRTEEGKMIRQAFIAPPQKVIVSADYSQIELRIMAHFSEDDGLLNAFANGEDVHQATAAAVEGVSLSEVSEEQRRRAKVVNFGLIYGMSAYGLSKQLGLDRADAQSLIDRYFLKYPGVLTYMNTVRQRAEQYGYVETLLGRKLYMPHAQSKNGMEKQAALRAAINAPMQGTAADIIKLAMLSIDQSMQNFDYQMTVQVHDELVFEVNETECSDFMVSVKELMEGVFKLKVPLCVNVASADNWESAH